MKIDGFPISSSQFANSNVVGRDDLFLLASPTDRNHLYYDDENLAYWNMCNQMFQEISSKYKLGSMAWQDENSYSPSSHSHDDIYNKTVITEHQTDGEHIATFVADGRTNVSVYFPRVVIYKHDDPYVGELKFVTDRSHRTINVDSEDFDGWVYPDGSQYNVSDFPDAAAAFGYSGTKFRVPELTDFFCGGTTKSSHVNATDVIWEHRHGTRLTFNPKTVTGTITVMGTSDTQGDGGGHNGSRTDATYPCTMEMKIQSISFNG